MYRTDFEHIAMHQERVKDFLREERRQPRSRRRQVGPEDSRQAFLGVMVREMEEALALLLFRWSLRLRRRARAL